MTKIRFIAAALSLAVMASAANAAVTPPAAPATYKVAMKPAQIASTHMKKHKKHKKPAMHAMLKKSPAKPKAV